MPQSNKNPETSTFKKLAPSVSLGLVLAVVFSLIAIVAVSKYQQPSRYVTEFTKVTTDYPVGRTEATTPEEKKVVAMLTQVAEKLKTQPWFSQANEHVLVTVTDLNNLPLTLDITNGTYKIRVGWFEPEKKTLAIPVDTFQLNRLSQIVADGNISESELYEISSVGLVPVLNSLYQADALYFPGDKRLLKMDNFMQVEIVNSYGLKDRNGNPLEAKATVLNVDGQWLVFGGFHGTPDTKYVITVEQMLKYYYLLQYKFNKVQPGDLLQRKELLDEYFQLRSETATPVKQPSQY